jgi:hypothetical protein
MLAVVAVTAGARSAPGALGFHCPFTAQRVTALTRQFTGVRLVAFATQNDGLHGTCTFVDPEPAVHSLLAGDRKFGLTFTQGLQTVHHEAAAWRATPGWSVAERPSIGKGAFSAARPAPSARSNNQLMLSFAASSGGSWGITIATQTSVHVSRGRLDAALVALHAARSDW